MSRPHPTVEKSLRAALPVGGRVLLAVSGGVDSMVLLHAASKLRAELKLTLEAAHLDHGLRPESGDDAAFVEAVAARLGVALHARREAGAPPGENVERWGREARYRFFSAVLSERALDFTATAHTASDLAETFLMRLVSNKELRSIDEFDPTRRLVRPLIRVTRSEIVSYARSEGIVWREDSSNQNTALLRNRVRHELLPVLERFDERIVETIAERARGVADDIEVLDKHVAALLGELEGEWGSREWLGGLKRAIETAPTELRWRFGEISVLSKLGFRIGRSAGGRFVEFVLGNGATLELPGGARIERRGGGFVFVTQQRRPESR